MGYVTTDKLSQRTITLLLFFFLDASLNKYENLRVEHQDK